MKRTTRAIALGMCLALVLGAAATAAGRARTSPLASSRVGKQTRKPARRCSDNLRRLGSAMRMYLRDWDDRLPAADRWSDGLSSYVKEPGTWYCPQRAPRTFSYAFNRRLGGRGMHDERIWGCALLFESSIARRNAADEGQSILSPGLHDAGNYFLFADGRVERRRERPSF